MSDKKYVMKSEFYLFVGIFFITLANILLKINEDSFLESAIPFLIGFVCCINAVKHYLSNKNVKNN